MSKIKKQQFLFIFSICGLIILLGISIFLGVSGWYYTLEKKQDFEIANGETMLVEVNKNQSNTLSFLLNGSLLQGQNISQKVNVLNSGEEGVYLRVKAYTHTMKGDFKCGISALSLWNENADGYYYFQEALNPNARAGVCDAIKLNEEIYLNSQKKYILTLMFETIGESVDVDAFWGNGKITIS